MKKKQKQIATIKEIRNLVGVTQKELASRLKTKQTWISNIERARNLRINTLTRLIKGMGGETKVICNFANNPKLKDIIFVVTLD